MKNTEVLKLIEAYEEILHGNDTHSGLVESCDSYYAPCFEEGLKKVENLRQEVVKNLTIPVVMLSCPFCGGVASVVKCGSYPLPDRTWQKTYRVECGECNVGNSYNWHEKTEKDAIKRWNNRA